MLRLSSSLGPSTPPSSSPRPLTRPSYSSGPSGSAPSHGKVECSNCKFLTERIKTLEAKRKILVGTLEMERHFENHTFESTAILHEIYNDMGKLCLEKFENQLGKNRLFGVGIPTEDVVNVARAISCSHDSLPFTYLGLPVGRNLRKLEAWSEVINKFSKRLATTWMVLEVIRVTWARLEKKQTRLQLYTNSLEEVSYIFSRRRRNLLRWRRNLLRWRHIIQETASRFPRRRQNVTASKETLEDSAERRRQKPYDAVAI
ncbi:hypothetical protein Tco_0690769 [Tanacetum coccineum]